MNAMARLAAKVAKPIAPKGVYAALFTPFTEAMEPDLPAMIDFARWLLANGCDGLSMLGSSGEGNSMSARRRMAILEGLVEAGLPPVRMIPGTGAASLGDVVEVTRHAVELGCGGALVLPPYYYKNPTDDGLFRAFAALIEQVADSRLRLYLYHIPQLSAVPVPHAVVERLVEAFPGIVAGLKDSSGDWSYSATLLQRVPGFGVYPGLEIFLAKVLHAGGAGCITGSANFTAPLCAQLAAARNDADVARLEKKLDQIRIAIESRPIIPALKAVQAEITGYAGWGRLLPPFTPLSDAERAGLFKDLDAILPRDAGHRWEMRA